MTAKDAGRSEMQRAGRMPFVPQVTKSNSNCESLTSSRAFVRDANGAKEVSYI
jgi:hypothetical protein